MSAEGSTKAILAALIANAGIVVAKFVAFLLTGAASMLAESIHSVADSSNQGLLLLGGRRARREAGREQAGERRPVVDALHPDFAVAGAAGRPARGRRRPLRSRPLPDGGGRFVACS